MRKFVFASLFISICAGAYTTSRGLGFFAPEIQGKANVTTPETGAIVLDSSDGNFWGNNGTTWTQLTNVVSSFLAPSVSDKSGVTSPETGAIVLDSSDGNFWGRNGTGWTQLTNGNGHLNVVTVSASDTIGENADVVLASPSSELTLTLPEADSDLTGKVITIKKADSSANAVIIDGYSTQTIDGSEKLWLAAKNDSVTLICDGTNWNILDSHFNDVRTASSANFDLTTSGFVSGEWAQMSQNSVSLVPGRWKVTITTVLSTNGTAAEATTFKSKISSNNGDNTTTLPSAFSSTSGVTKISGVEQGLNQISNAETRWITTTHSAIYDAGGTTAVDLFGNIQINFSTAGAGFLKMVVDAERLN